MTLQKYFVDFETSIHFPSAWGWLENDWNWVFGRTFLHLSLSFNPLSWKMPDQGLLTILLSVNISKKTSNQRLRWSLTDFHWRAKINVFLTFTNDVQVTSFGLKMYVFTMWFLRSFQFYWQTSEVFTAARSYSANLNPEYQPQNPAGGVHYSSALLNIMFWSSSVGTLAYSMCKDLINSSPGKVYVLYVLLRLRLVHQSLCVAFAAWCKIWL